MAVHQRLALFTQGYLPQQREELFDAMRAAMTLGQTIEVTTVENSKGPTYWLKVATPWKEKSEENA